MAEEAEPQFEQRDLFEYKIYQLNRKTTLKQNQTKQMLLLSASDIKAKKIYLIDGGYIYYSLQEAQKIKAKVMLEFKNSADNNLGMPLPKGKVRAFKRDVDGSVEFIGEDGVNASSLKEQTPSDPEKVYEVLLTYVQRLYRKAELVHGDLSEYNIMLWKGKPVVFDVAQAVPVSHPMAEFFLRRDLTNVNRFFKRLGVNVLSVEEAYSRVVG